MIQFEGMRPQESGSSNKQLPAGPYVAKVLGARVIGQAPDQQLEVMLDIAEGQYTDFYMNKFTAQKQRGSNYEVRYKGILKLRIPNPDNKNALYPESDIRRFNDMIYRFEKSNDGFHWDGDESRLTDLTVGISVQDDEFNGNQFTKPVRFEIADDVRNGRVSKMPPKWEQRNRQQDPTKAPTADRRSGMQIVTEKLPWD